MNTPCRLCGGAAHPATGCAYTPTFIVCKRCTLEAWTKARGLLAHINGKGGRKGFYFYEHVKRSDETPAR